MSLKQPTAEDQHCDDDDCRPLWRRRLSIMAFNWTSFLKITLLLLLVAAIASAFSTLPVEKILKDFLVWVKQDLGPWGPLMLALAYIPLTVLAVPASVLTLGGGYLFGLPVGFVADSIGATLGAVAAFLIGRTIGRSYVTSKLKDYPQFRAVAIAIRRSGFKIVLLLRFVPLLPFNMLNYLLSVTPVPLGEYMLASWLGMMVPNIYLQLPLLYSFMMARFFIAFFFWNQSQIITWFQPITLALVYVGTTLKDLSDVTHGWHEFSKTRWVMIITGFLMSVVLLVCVTKVAKAALEKALAENEDTTDGIGASPELPTVADPTSYLHQPLVVKIDPSRDDHEN